MSTHLSRSPYTRAGDDILTFVQARNDLFFHVFKSVQAPTDLSLPSILSPALDYFRHGYNHPDKHKNIFYSWTGPTHAPVHYARQIVARSNIFTLRHGAVAVGSPESTYPKLQPVFLQFYDAEGLERVLKLVETRGLRVERINISLDEEMRGLEGLEAEIEAETRRLTRCWDLEWERDNWVGRQPWRSRLIPEELVKMEGAVGHVEPQPNGSGLKSVRHGGGSLAGDPEGMAARNSKRLDADYKMDLASAKAGEHHHNVARKPRPANNQNHRTNNQDYFKTTQPPLQTTKLHDNSPRSFQKLRDPEDYSDSDKCLDYNNVHYAD